jgi:GNAT superfamily N-acetyltransferase
VPGNNPGIRRARPDEAAALSALVLRSKGHWGYDAAFLEACREDLTLSAAEIARDAVFVIAAGDGPPAGYYRVLDRIATSHGPEPGADGDMILDALFVAPEAIGRGHGRRLFAHAVALAAAQGARGLTWTSDPHATGFYHAMGARLIGETPSTVFPGRLLPTFRIALPLPVDRSPAHSSPD